MIVSVEFVVDVGRDMKKMESAVILELCVRDILNQGF